MESGGDTLPVPDAQQAPKRVGMLLEKLDGDLLESIVGIYDKVFEGDGLRSFHPRSIEQVHETLSRINVCDFRYGSIFSINSKLEVVKRFSPDPAALGKTVINFDFYVNAPLDPRSQRKLERLEETFQSRVTRLLIKKGLVVILE